MGEKTQIKIPSANSDKCNSLYSQTAGIKESRTYIPGMKTKGTDGNSAENISDPLVTPLHIIFQNRPIAGILYSVSRDACGEIFPVYVGRNIIGSAPECDIYLTEESISQKHAILLIRIVTLSNGEKKVTMSLSDTDSDFGTRINDEFISDTIQPLSAGDIIQVGKAYQLVFIPIDAHSYGLAPVDGFTSIPRVENRPDINNDYLKYMLPYQDNAIYPDSVGEDDELTFYGRSKGPKEDHSNKKTL